MSFLPRTMLRVEWVAHLPFCQKKILLNIILEMQILKAISYTHNPIIKGSSDVSTTMRIFISLPNFKSLCVLLMFQNAGVQQKIDF